MKEFLEYLLKEITSRPSELKVEEIVEDGVYVYRITAAQEDMGTIIGKEGHNIKSIRDLAKAKAIKDNIRIRIFIEDNK